ncbi:hypothetical protein PVAG01_03867 [Phlyctema vagabunda]|uniref:CBM1 domain-containing protein n=1 Tax=Phlyctema vagabunda TaxID=108571 RepID=A0ABR4PMM3_9HELO
MYFSSTILATVAALAGSATSAILWDGRFNDLSTSTDLNNWSWANQVGPYQYYIHGSGAVTEYVNLASTYKNPADTGSKQGAKISLTSTAYWNGQTMRRTELIPQTSAAIASGTVWYHFSIKRSDVNPPSTFREHQIAFFESHFTELKYGGSGGSNTLRWCVSGADKWTTPWTADVWHNVAYEINFAAGSVAFWHSTGSDPLTLTVPAVSVSASSNGADWHVGVLELPVSGQADANEDYYFSGVYIESGSLTKTVAGPGGVVSSSSATGPVVSTTGETSSSSSVSLVSPSSSVATVESVSSIRTSSVAAAQPTTTAAGVSSSISSVISSEVSTLSSSISAIPTTIRNQASSSVCSKKPVSTSTQDTTAAAVTQPALTSSSVATVAAVSKTKSVCSKRPSSSSSSSSSFLSVPTTFATQIAVLNTSSLVSNVPASSGSATQSVCSKKTSAVPTTLSTATTPATSAPATTAPSTGGTLAKWSQCGGQGWSGSGTCVAGTTCTAQNSYYSQCL